MHAIYHFIISVSIGATLARHQKNPLAFSVVCGVLGMLPDIDHIIPLNSSILWGNSSAFAVDHLGHQHMFHNSYVLVVLPFFVLIGAFVFDGASGRETSSCRRAALAVFVVLVGHMALDLAAGNSFLVNPSAKDGYIVLTSAPILSMGSSVILSQMDLPLVMLAALALSSAAYSHALYIRNEAAHEAEASDKADFTTETCPNCEGGNVIRRGTRETKHGQVQRFGCLDCDHIFTVDKGHRIVYPFCSASGVRTI